MSTFSEVNSLFEGKFSYTLSWNSEDFFESNVIVIMLAHKPGKEISRAIDSVLSQVGPIRPGLLLIDDSTTNACVGVDERISNHPSIAVASTPPLSVSQGRNIGHYIVKTRIQRAEWICRLDTDDVLASTNSLKRIYHQLQAADSTVQWALAGNRLVEEGSLLNRVNKATLDLSNPTYVLDRLQSMANGESEAELPSCNLWIRTGFKAVYPGMESAEDHWLVAHLLINQMDEGLLLTDAIHAVYSLSGGVTLQNKHSDQYRFSRHRLHESARYWVGREIKESSNICLGWGSEGVVWYNEGNVVKQFHSMILSDDHAAWLSSMDDIPAPKATWQKENQGWTATYPYEALEEAISVDLPTLSKFVSRCLVSKVVFLNTNRANLRLRNGELHCIDLGEGIVPFEMRYFRDMCARLYLLFVQHLSDKQLAARTLELRNNIPNMKAIEGFEQFFHREVHKHVYHNGSFLKPKRDIQPEKRHHNDVTLMIKSCAMEASTIARQASHIVRQICKFDAFRERVLLIDPKQDNFLREYATGDMGALREAAQQLVEKHIVDRVLISPLEGNEPIITDLYHRWFSLKSNQTHSSEGVPIFPQLWGFEQIQTRFLLQMDADVMIGRADVDDDLISTMLHALSKEYVFGVGFNIPQQIDDVFTPYNGKFVPEVRCGLLDLERMFEQRPFPNAVNGDYLTTSWYRSIEQFQKANDWRCLRGGDPRSWYIHPPNFLKQDLEYYDKTIDLVEQNTIPLEQRGHWDLIEGRHHWKYPERREEVIFCVTIKDWSPHWTRAMLRSLFIQKNENWGAVLFDDCSTPKHQAWLALLVEEFSDRVTLVRRRFESVDEAFILRNLREICTQEDPMIFSLGHKEILFDSEVLSFLGDMTPVHTSVVGTTYLARHPLGLPMKGTQVTSNKYNLPQSIRAQRLSSFSGVTENAISRPASIEHALLLTSPRVYNANMDVESEGSNQLRPTTYIPNLRKLEIDITYFCNLTCAGCSRSSAQAPSDQHMPLTMIHDFLEESERKGMIWEALHILGGEPTLHPNFVEIVTMLDEWFMEHSPDTDLKVITNGVSKKVQKNIMKIPEHWRYENSYKLDREVDTSHFEPFNLAPIDLPEWRNEDFTKGCYITQDSGIGLTPYGYFHCAIAGGMERIMKLGHGFDSIPDHPWQFLEMMKDYCRFCGHFLSDSFKERSDRIGTDVSPETVSNSWQSAYETWEVEGDA